MRMGCVFGWHTAWSRWNYYRSASANDRPLWKYRRCILCGKYQKRNGVNHASHRHPALYYDPG
jgi:hypothetical protein